MRFSFSLLGLLVVLGTTSTVQAQCAVAAAHKRRAHFVHQLQQRQQQQANLHRQQQQQAVLQARRQQQIFAQQQQRQAFLQLQQQRQAQMNAVRQRVIQMKRAELMQAMLRNQALLRQAVVLKNNLLQRALVRDFREMQNQMADEADRRWGDEWKKEVPPEPKPEKPKTEVASLSAKKQEPTKLSAIPTKVDSDEVLSLGTALIGADGFRQEHVLMQLRKGKGSTYTKALALAIPLLGESTKKKARKTLAERLVRMKASTLQNYLTHEHAEIRRAAVLAVAMKHEVELISQLVERLNDDEDTVSSAARASLRAMTKQDFGPEPNADSQEQANSVQQWKAWISENVASR